MGEFVFYAAFVLFILFGPWILVWRGRLRRERERLENDLCWRELAARISTLEQAVKDLRESRKTPAAPPATQTPAESRSPSPFPAPTAPSESPATPLARAIPPSQVAAEAWVAKRSAESRYDSPPVSVSVSVPTPPPPSFVHHAEPIFHSVDHGPSFTERFKSALDIEEALGTNWLNKLGVIILVLGIAFFLAYELKTFDPAGKVLLGYAVSAVMLGGGIWFERGERYRILARAGIGGGWALLFFTTYAMYHVPAARVLSSQATDLALMLVVATVMVWHTLRYQSQVVTGLAFLLAFLTVTISHSNVYSLSAGAVLAAGLVVIVGRMQWFELELFGILASYFNHYLWLRPIIEPMHGRRHPFAEFPGSAGILLLYWLVFRTSYVFRKPINERQEHISTAAALMNTGFLLALFKYQSTHPEWAFWALLAIGTIETALGQLPITRRRRTAVIVLSTLGVILLLAAFPFRYSGTRLSVLWLLEAEALLLIGVWTREVVFRRLGALATLLVAGQMVSVDAARICGMRSDDADVRSYPRIAMLFAVGAVVFYANAHWVFRRWKDLFQLEFDRRLMQRLSYVGAVMALIGAWIAFPEAWTAVAWSALGLLLALSGRRFAIPELTYQANSLAVAAVSRLLLINLDATSRYHGFTLRLITISLVAILLYVTSRWSWATTDADSVRAFSSGAYTWTASFLFALLAWYELRPVGVAVAWAIGGMILFELGLGRKSLALRLQGYTAFAASFSRIFFVNLNASGNPGEVSPRFYTVVPLALVFFYGYWRLHESENDRSEFEKKLKVEAICCYLGTITLAALIRFEMPADWVAAAWAALSFALLAIAWRSERPIFMHQGLLLCFGVLFRTVLHNFYERSYFPAPAWESRWITVGATVALLLLALPLAFQVRRKDEPSEEFGLVRLLQALVRRPEQVFFFIAVGLLTVLLALEMRHGMVTLSWGVEGLVIFMLALWLGERSFRLSGLGLLLLCAGKILLVDVWRLNPRDRYLTFIVLGVALLLVSFLYTRNREALRQYL
jgi:uncharacterized membrane protein